MKMLKNKFAVLAASLLMLSACQPFSEYENNPNSPSKGQVPPTFLLNTVIQKTLGCYRPLIGVPCGWSQYIASISAQQGDLEFQGYLGGEAGFTYGIMRDIDAMEYEADRVNSPAYRGVGSFFKVWNYLDMTLQMGDVPMSDAMKGESEANFTPKYDTQKQVFINCLDMLDEANGILAQAAQEKVSLGSGDLIFNGEVAQWQKAANALRLRTLINLSKRSDDVDLKVKEQFAEIMNNPAKYPLFESNADNVTFRWYDIEDNRYLWHYLKANVDYYRIGNTYYNLIKKYNDPRISVIAERTKVAQDANPDNTNFDVNEYGGVNANDLYDAIYSTRDQASTFNRERYCTPVGEPMILLGYSEQCFNIAEAINRGWIEGDADAYYKAGIRASMEFYEIDEAVISDYLNSSAVAYNNDLEQILNQKYISFFNNSGWEPFYNMRRTGVPAYQIGSNMSNPSGKVPVRWRYPRTEYQTNEANVKEAIQRQYNGSDEVDDVMWILE